MVSPSSSAKMRMMPCMAGCAGPMLTCRCSDPPPIAAPSPRNSSRVVGSAMVSELEGGLRPPFEHPPRSRGAGEARALSGTPSRGWFGHVSRTPHPDAWSDLRPDERLPPVDGIVLAQRVPDELLVEEQAPQIRMALEADTEHVPHLSLEPVGDGPESARGGHPRVVLLHPHL